MRVCRTGAVPRDRAREGRPVVAGGGVSPAVARDDGPSQIRVFLLLGNTGPHASKVADALAASGRIATAGVSSDPVQGVEEAAMLAPDVVVVDRFVGLADGLVVARHLHADRPSVGIVLRTPWPDADRHGAQRAGVRVTVDAAATVDELVRAILEAAVG